MCTVWIQQEPVPILAKPFTSTVDSHNLYGHTHIQVWWPAIANPVAYPTVILFEAELHWGTPVGGCEASLPQCGTH